MTGTVAPASDLRRAALVLRERGAAVPPGPYVTTNGSQRFGGLVSTTARPYDKGYGGKLIGESMSPADMGYFALFAPPFDGTLADLLDSVADIEEQHALADAATVRLAYAVARTVLRAAGL